MHGPFLKWALTWATRFEDAFAQLLSDGLLGFPRLGDLLPCEGGVLVGLLKSFPRKTWNLITWRTEKRMLKGKGKKGRRRARNEREGVKEGRGIGKVEESGALGLHFVPNFLTKYSPL